ncbi:FkbM family methyltransferase [Bradyrhizobium sp. USDA 3686]|uniref:FkbM family methyltransferase n=1 Tax=Bradyrhizobium TaxID=374 RepID=UPI00195E90EF|nr:FkbM family methyltransferase [Bradyrhizobium canariense]MBM7488392.1 FkbM family methyltransferase [Bradyrhizobium canariense]UFW71063.1 FkbM family methyltransferase [Bradyrhizobium canariense]
MSFLGRVLHQAHNLKQITGHPLNNGHELSAVARWLLWHLSSRLALGPMVVPFVNESTLVVEPGMTSATGNIFWGLSEPEEMGFCLHLLRQGDIFLDVGANVGVFSVLARTAGASVISIEPGPAAFSALKRNVSINGYCEGVDLQNVAVSDRSGTARFAYAAASTTNHLLGPNETHNSIDVPMTTLDALIDNRPVSLMKIDIEGYELPALRGATSLLASRDLKAIIVEVNQSSDRYGYSRSELLNLINSAGFMPTAYDPYARSFVPAEKGTSDNLIFVRDIDTTQRRLIEAPRFTLSGGRSSI